MKINWDENCNFGGAFEGATLEYGSSFSTPTPLIIGNGAELIYWWNNIYRAGYEVTSIKGFNIEKLFKWAGIDDYPECMSRNL